MVQTRSQTKRGLADIEKSKADQDPPAKRRKKNTMTKAKKSSRTGPSSKKKIKKKHKKKKKKSNQLNLDSSPPSHQSSTSNFGMDGIYGYSPDMGGNGNESWHDCMYVFILYPHRRR